MYPEATGYAQRLADVLVEQGLAEYRDNSAHRRARLLAATDAGLAAVRRIHPERAAFANRITEGMDAAELTQALASVEALLRRLDADA